MLKVAKPPSRLHLVATMALEADEASKGMSSYAKKFPKYKRTGNLHTDCEGESNRLLAMNIVEKLVGDPSLAGPINSWLEARQSQQTKAIEIQSGRWHVTYCYLEKLSKDWCAEFLTMLAGNTNPSVNMTLLNTIDSHDMQAIKRIFYFVSFTTPSTKLPRECLDKAVCSMTLQRRCQEVGSRIQVVGEAASSMGIVDWKKLGVYKLTFNDSSRCVSVTHVSGTTTSIPEHILIDTTYTLLHNELDMQATVKKGVAEYKLCEPFDINGLPWTLALDKKASHLKALAIEQAAALEVQKKAMQSSVVTGLSKPLQDAAQKRKQAIMEKARQSRAANPPKTRRTEISLQPGAASESA